MKSVSLKTVFNSFVLVTLLVYNAAAAPRTPDDLIETDCAGDNQSASSVLIAYDTIHGSTAEVAEAIGEDLCDMGYEVDVRLVTNVEDITEYDGVIIGSALYKFNWLPDALNFIEQNKAVLSQVPTAYFIVGASMSEDTPEAREAATASFINPVLEQFSEIEPVTIGLFGGEVDFTTNSYNLFEKFVLRILGRILGFKDSADWRDWEVIGQWAVEVGEVI